MDLVTHKCKKDYKGPSCSLVRGLQTWTLLRCLRLTTKLLTSFIHMMLDTVNIWQTDTSTHTHTNRTASWQTTVCSECTIIWKQPQLSATTAGSVLCARLGGMTCELLGWSQGLHGDCEYGYGASVGNRTTGSLKAPLGTCQVLE